MNDYSHDVFVHHDRFKDVINRIDMNMTSLKFSADHISVFDPYPRYKLAHQSSITRAETAMSRCKEIMAYADAAYNHAANIYEALQKIEVTEAEDG